MKRKLKTWSREGLTITGIWVENGQEIEVSMTLTTPKRYLAWEKFKSSKEVKNPHLVACALYDEYRHKKIVNWLDDL